MSKEVFVILLLFVATSYGARPDDELVLTNFNQSLFIKDESYVFRLQPTFKVPLQIIRHKIYTSTTETVQRIAKRALFDQRDTLYQLSEEEHQLLSELLDAPLPSFVKIDKKKRSLSEVDENGLRVISLGPKIAVVHSGGIESKKRGAQELGTGKVKIGTTFCLHIPFFTTCDNSADLGEVKDALQSQVDAAREELDSYKKTNDARENEMAKVLEQQRDLLTTYANMQTDLNNLIATTAASVATNAAQIAHGDYVIHAQINYLKRVTNSLLRYTNSLASTDARTVVAQPSLSKLFTGYKTMLQVLNDNNLVPIIDSRSFNFTEALLPSQSISNISETNGTTDSTFTSSVDGFKVVLKGSCSAETFSSKGQKICSTWSFPQAEGWMYGPFHQSHYGVYNLINSSGFLFSTPQMNLVVDPALSPVVSPKSGNSIQCVQFLGYKVLADFTSTPYMKNGITPNSTAVPLSDCQALMLRQADSSSKQIYRLFTVNEGVVIPLYSNCYAPRLNQIVPTLNFGWLSSYPTVNAQASPPVADIVSSSLDVSSRNWISSDCYINLEPGWIDASYYIYDNSQVIRDIPRGYKLNQFTVNPEGELSSSLEFVYTSEWVQVYTIKRESQNRVIVDEVGLLEDDLVLFHPTVNSVIDESDAFFGEGNNGRDCIQFHDDGIYEYDLTSCFYQNNEQGYLPSDFNQGLVTSTGISRFTNKFSFSYTKDTNSVYRFTLVPKSEADFSFYVDSDGTLCPSLVSRVSGSAGCEFTFYYQGSSAISVVDSNQQSTVINFNNYSGIADVSLGTFTLKSGNRDCLLLTCQYNFNSSTIKLETPNVQIISSDEQRLVTKVSFAISETIGQTLTQMTAVQNSVQASNAELASIIDQLKSLNFNVTKILPYEDFTELRKQVDEMIASLDTQSGETCDTPWVSATCFFQQFGTTIITVAAVLIFAVILFLIFVKGGLAKKMCK